MSLVTNQATETYLINLAAHLHITTVLTNLADIDEHDKLAEDLTDLCDPAAHDFRRVIGKLIGVPNASALRQQLLDDDVDTIEEARSAITKWVNIAKLHGDSPTVPAPTSLRNILTPEQFVGYMSAQDYVIAFGGNSFTTEVCHTRDDASALRTRIKDLVLKTPSLRASFDLHRATSGFVVGWALDVTIHSLKRNRLPITRW